MKIWVVILSLVLSSSALAHKVDPHHPHGKSHSSHEQMHQHEHTALYELEKSVTRLEEQNRLLKKKLKRMNEMLSRMERLILAMETSQQPEVVQPKEKFTCKLTTPFDGTFVASDTSKLGAKAKVQQACEAKTKGGWCDDARKMECEKINW